MKKLISRLDDKDLIETFLRAVELELEKDFISILEAEIKRRAINIEEKASLTIR